MSIGSQFASQPSVTVPYSVHRFSVTKYREMVASGILAEDDRVELLEGWITPKMTHNPPHDVAVGLADEALRAPLPSNWKVRVQSAITTAESEPEPDIAVVRGPLRRYTEHHPGSGDVALIAEVAETSLKRDRNKRRIYARAKIAVYWIINLVDSQIEVYLDPSGSTDSPHYSTEAIYRPGDELPVIIAGHQLSPLQVDDLLP